MNHLKMPSSNTIRTTLQAVSRTRPPASLSLRAYSFPRSYSKPILQQVQRPRRFYSSETSASEVPIQPKAQSRPLTDRPNSSIPAPNFSHKPLSAVRTPKPEYQITFTCTPCSTRSTHRISKQGYHRGSVLISCPECKNRHIISDHLGIFSDHSITIEDIMKERGQLVKRGTLSEDGGDIEFWADENAKKDEGKDDEVKQ